MGKNQTITHSSPLAPALIKVGNYVIKLVFVGLFVSGAYFFIAAAGIKNNNEELIRMKATNFTLSMLSLYLLYYIGKTREKGKKWISQRRSKLRKKLEINGEFSKERDLVEKLEHYQNNLIIQYGSTEVILISSLIISSVLSIYLTNFSYVFTALAIAFFGWTLYRIR